MNFRSNGFDEKLEFLSGLSSSSANQIDVLLWDWLHHFLINTDLSEIFSLIQSRVLYVFPRTARLHVVGVSVKEDIVKALIPFSNFEEINTTAMVDTAYQTLYIHSWGNEMLVPITNSQVLATLDIQAVTNFLFEDQAVSLTFSAPAKMSGLLFYLECEIDGEEWAFSTRDSDVYEQPLIILRHPIDGLPQQVVTGLIGRKSANSLSVKLTNPNSADHIDAKFRLPVL